MASRFPSPAALSISQAQNALPPCEICGAAPPLIHDDVAQVFSRQYAVVHSAVGHRVQEDYVCTDCGTAFLVGARMRAALAEEG